MLRVGDVIVLFSGTIPDPKPKWHLCVSVGRGWFFRINTRGHWGPPFALSAAENPCLKHDCYIELNAPVQFDEYEIEEALRVPANYKGRLSDTTLARLAEHIPKVRTIPKAEKKRIVEELGAVLP